jgi:hypothetical protein
MSDAPVSFIASFPDIQSAIKITGGGSGMRVQLDIPEIEVGNAAALLLYRGYKTFKVTIEPDDTYEQNTPISRRQTKRRD